MMRKTIDGFRPRRSNVGAIQHGGRQRSQATPLEVDEFSDIEQLTTPTRLGDAQNPLKPGHNTWRPQNSTTTDVMHAIEGVKPAVSRQTAAPKRNAGIDRSALSQQSDVRCMNESTKLTTAGSIRESGLPQTSVSSIQHRKTEKDTPSENTEKEKRSFLRMLIGFLQYPLTAIVAVSAAYSTSIGQWFIVAYIAYVIVRRVNSRTTFILALMLLIAIPTLQLLQQPGVSENIAIYTFELLVVGVLQSVFELKFNRKSDSREPSMV